MGTTMVDCVLINSPDDLYSEHYLADPKIPLGLVYIASYLRSHGVSVVIIDCHAQKHTLDELVQIVKNNQPYLVGLNITTPNRRVVYKIAERIKEEAAPPAVIIGGPHASCLPEDVFKNAPHIDGLVMGEGEEIIYKVLQSLPRIESFPGFYTRAADPSIRRLAPRIVDLDSLPLPAYDLIDVRRYAAVSPELYVASSRGCRYDCAFCCSRVLLGRQVIFRSHTNVVEEMALLKNRYGIDSFYFYDDNILIWPELEDFCIKMSNVGIQWTAQATMNDLHLDMIPLLSSARCYRLSFGLESGSLAIQKYVGKVIKPDAAKKIARLLEYGVSSRAFFVIGFPNETIHDIAETAKYIVELRASGLADIAIFPARPFPGTRLFHDCIGIHGDGKLESILEFQYLEDYKDQSDPRINAKLHRYNTIPSFQISRYFDSLEIRRMIKTLYDIFYNYTQFVGMSSDELTSYLLSKG